MILVLICGSGAVLLFLTWKLMLQVSPQPCTFAEWTAEKRNLDIEVFRLLVDKQEILYLRRILPRSCLRRVLRRRAMLAQRYVAGIEKNAQMLLSIAARAQSSPDPETARAARELMRLMPEVKLNIELAIWCLRIKRLFPTATFALPTRLAAYDRLVDRGRSLVGSPNQMASKVTGA